ncbi:MAG: DUF1538 domain-containing protein [Clostridiales bacterium]|nr:DUF1538 domain-containing protein [Clostridiales bacterium]
MDNKQNRLWEKMKEALASVLPITGIVILLHILLVPMPSGTFGLFLVGAVLLTFGMALFTLGADIAMMPMGERIGAHLTKTKKLGMLLFVGVLIGVLITVAEPDLTVLANQIPAVPNAVLILTVAVGVGIFFALALVKTAFNIPLNVLLVTLYVGVFALAAFTPQSFLAVAFDSGGVTTGPITVPFIMALGIGIAAVRGGNSSQDDSFGIVALCSIGPIFAVLLLGIFFNADSGSYAAAAVQDPGSFRAVLAAFGEALPHYFREVAIALAPIVVFFVVFQFLFLRMRVRTLLKLAVGVIYTFFGLVLFLTGVNVGFLPAGYFIGGEIAVHYKMLLIPLGMLMGFFVVMAEPAVHVLTKQVEEITVGAIGRNTLLMSLSFGVSASIGIAMLRVITGVSIWYFLLAGYGIALALSFFVPKVFTAIAFDSGGVASGPMTATFLLPFAMGACVALGGNIMTDAFGLVAMVAMTPLITIQILGVIYKIKRSRADVLPAKQDETIEIFEFDWQIS